VKEPLYPNAAWRPIQYNFNPGGKNTKLYTTMKGVRGLCLHITSGSNLIGTYATFNNPDNKRSAHFCSDKDGTMHQFLKIGDVAWGIGGDPPYDWYWLSLENVATVGQSLTEEQIMAAANLMAWLNRVYGVPLQISEHKDTPGLAYHSMFGIKAREFCPGRTVIAQRQRILDSAAAGY
jgi:N-acetyl-anhydromuramyl-L-alanine amidase AmpD